MFEQVSKKWRSLGKSIKENISLVFSFIGFLGWLGITPEMAGDGVYSIVRIAVPIIEFFLGAWFMHSMLTRKHAAEKNGFKIRIDQAEGKAQAYAEESARLKKENKSLVCKIDELEAEKVKPNFSYLSDEEKAMAASAYKERELFPTPNASVFTYPDITLSQLQKRNIVRKVCVRKVGAVNIDMWQIEPAASEVLDGNPGLLNQLRDAFTRVYDAAVEKREREELEEKEELLDGYSCKLSQVDIRSRAMLRALILGYNVYCFSGYWSESSYEYDALLQSLVEWEFDSDEAVELFPTSLLMELYRYDSDLFKGKVDDYLQEREGAPNGWKTAGLGATPRFDFPWYWEKNEGDDDVQ